MMKLEVFPQSMLVRTPKIERIIQTLIPKLNVNKKSILEMVYC